jgi:hypothetical protein
LNLEPGPLRDILKRFIYVTEHMLPTPLPQWTEPDGKVRLIGYDGIKWKEQEMVYKRMIKHIAWKKHHKGTTQHRS